ncbi:phenylacetic acid degradation operon negative regulatory protein [Arthrobacter ginsengisoli]|uniref:Phenylacetic acid degradation operon negative regulatory protein n=1 Tax=Arthrobacter ginsengisoli TaxID=1356565 RepID=A0ABU1UEE4_9MICC|nr:PaaX family transcriptional regulator C-terminal domain-containing protein [Arthrobacter ginsengisoli]MDR7083557.1 phenylacetic acid degradation operon negative regulatory protein [Arthrobacter ginsengisoli]
MLENPAPPLGDGLDSDPAAGNAVPRPTPRHQQLIVTIYGLYGRSNGGALPVSVLISMLDDLGVESSGVRSSVSRLKRRGVLESVRQGGVAAYRLAPNLEDVFQEGDRRIFSPRRATAADRWLLIAFSVPESQRHLRHQLRSMLTRMGFGSVTPGLWIAPGNTYEDISHQLERAGLTEYVEFFKAEHLTAGDVKDKVSRWWDLPALESLYAEFIERFAPVLARWEAEAAAPGPDADRAAFADYVQLLTQWRRLPYLDPGLPAEFLPAGWHGLTAERIFAELHRLLNGPARQHAERLLAATGTSGTA